jgi:hypothetical protein
MAVKESLSKEIADLHRCLAELDRERASVLAALEQLKRPRTDEIEPPSRADAPRRLDPDRPDLRLHRQPCHQP